MLRNEWDDELSVYVLRMVRDPMSVLDEQRQDWGLGAFYVQSIYEIDLTIRMAPERGGVGHAEILGINSETCADRLVMQLRQVKLRSGGLILLPWTFWTPEGESLRVA